MKIYKFDRLVRDSSMKPPQYGFHLTYMSRLNNILNRGLLLPKSMNPYWVRTRWENAIYMFIDPQHTNFFANHISMDRHKDWVLLKIINIDSTFVAPDYDWGDTWQESIMNANSFAYTKSIPSSDIAVFDKAEKTKIERHDEFERYIENENKSE
jgi:hypothetical protein